MVEIAENVFIEESYPRVVLGIIKLDQGTVAIDSPFLIEDVQFWRAKFRHLGSGMESLLLLLDPHIDRTLMAQAMETDVIVHENAAAILSNRSVSSKSNELEIGPDWTHTELPQGVRFIKPHFTFSKNVIIHWGKDPLMISHMSGAHLAGSWLIYDAQKVVFIGDSVVIDQPPFLAKADLQNWLKDLEWLLSDRFEGYQIVSGRNGVIQRDSVEKMKAFLVETKGRIDELTNQETPLSGVSDLSSQLLKKMSFDTDKRDRYFLRLTRGLEQYINRYYSKEENDTKGEDE